jgi:hypothetical protein
MNRRAAVAFTLATAVAIPMGTPRMTAQGSGLTGAAQVARAYDTIMDARFTDVPARLSETCPPAPAEVCKLLSLVSMWWQIQLDPLSRTRDETFQKQADVAIADMEKWTMREPMRAEAWFYLGGSIGARAQWRALRGELLAAARDGKRIKSALERALALDPSLQDAYFGIGLYHYYAAVAPAAARMLRWLLLLPAAIGRKDCGDASRRSGGQLLRSEADYQLHLVYLWYEKQPARARTAVGAGGTAPAQSAFSSANCRNRGPVPRHARGKPAHLGGLIERARHGRWPIRTWRRTRAQLGAALELYHLGQLDAAIPYLRA